MMERTRTMAIRCAEEDDLPRIIGLLQACRRAGYVDMEFRSIELRFALGDPEFAREQFTAMFERRPGGDLLAFAILWRGRFLGMLVHPEARGQVEHKIIRWGAETVAEHHSDEMQARLWLLCRDDDRLSRRLYETDGFVLDDEELRMSADLGEPPEEPRCADGFRIRPLREGTETENWADLYNEAFARVTHSQRWTTLRGREAIMRDPDYQPELDLVAESPDGELAAFCYCSIAAEEASGDGLKEGRMEPIATRARYRRLGLARARVLTGLHELRRRGMDVASLTTDVETAPAHRLYESLGFRPTYRARWYVRDPEPRGEALG